MTLTGSFITGRRRSGNLSNPRRDSWSRDAISTAGIINNALLGNTLPGIMMLLGESTRGGIWIGLRRSGGPRGPGQHDRERERPEQENAQMFAQKFSRWCWLHHRVVVLQCRRRGAENLSAAIELSGRRRELGEDFHPAAHRSSCRELHGHSRIAVVRQRCENPTPARLCDDFPKNLEAASRLGRLLLLFSP